MCLAYLAYMTMNCAGVYIQYPIVPRTTLIIFAASLGGAKKYTNTPIVKKREDAVAIAIEQ